jgi:hypothetical protein
VTGGVTGQRVEASLDRRVVDGDELAVLVRYGACTGPNADPDWFLPEAGAADVRRAQRVCSGCPVRERCRRWATAHDEHGVWGGEEHHPGGGRSDPELRDAARRLFAEGEDHRQVAALLGISTQRAIGFGVAWRRQQRRTA